MSSYVLELLGREHDREGFVSGLESVDRYLRETARGHAEKGVSVTRVLVAAGAPQPKKIAGFLTLSSITVEARDWPGAPKGLPKQAVSAVLLGRLAVDVSAQGLGLGKMLVAAAKQLASESIARSGGVGLAVDAANEEVIGFYERFGFRRVAEGSMRMFLPTASLVSAERIPSG